MNDNNNNNNNIKRDYVIDFFFSSSSSSSSFFFFFFFFFACGYTSETSVYSPIGRTSLQSEQILTPEKFRGGLKAWHVPVTHPSADHAPSCLTWLWRATAPGLRHRLSFTILRTRCATVAARFPQGKQAQLS